MPSRKQLAPLGLQPQVRFLHFLAQHCRSRAQGDPGGLQKLPASACSSSNSKPSPTAAAASATAPASTRRRLSPPPMARVRLSKRSSSMATLPIPSRRRVYLHLWSCLLHLLVQQLALDGTGGKPWPRSTRQLAPFCRQRQRLLAQWFEQQFLSPEQR